MQFSRRGFLGVLGVALAAPMVAKAEFLMPVKKLLDPYTEFARIFAMADKDNLGDLVINDIYRDMYYHDPTTGSAIELLATIPFSDFTLTKL